MALYQATRARPSPRLGTKARRLLGAIALSCLAACGGQTTTATADGQSYCRLLAALEAETLPKLQPIIESLSDPSPDFDIDEFRGAIDAVSDAVNRALVAAPSGVRPHLQRMADGIGDYRGKLEAVDWDISRLDAEERVALDVVGTEIEAAGTEVEAWLLENC